MLVEELQYSLLQKQIALDFTSYINHIRPGRCFSPSSTVRLKHMKMPAFDGDTRDYPRCQSDSLKQVVPEMKSKDLTEYVFRTYLTKIPLNIVKNVDDDSDEM